MTAYFQQLFSFGFYKRTQGKIARQGTFIALAIAVAAGAFSLKTVLDTYDATLPSKPQASTFKGDDAAYNLAVETHNATVDSTEQWVKNVHRSSVPVMFAVFALGAWAAFRLVQFPVFADFLISVEAEMNKVTWPKRGELWRASLVVILTIFVLAALLYAYDAIWRFVLSFII